MIYVTSLTDHRIDVKFADYITTALSHISLLVTRFNVGDEIPPTTDLDVIIVTNGVMGDDEHTSKVLQLMHKLPSLYLIDDHTCWIPSLTIFHKCTILSQFVEHPIDKNTKMEYFRVSELSLFDARFDQLQHMKLPKELKYGYWGRYKPERYSYYKEYFGRLDTPITIIGDRYPHSLHTLNLKFRPFTKNLEELNDSIADFSHTYVFGDEHHNGVNTPYRIYEALMNGVVPEIDNDLIGAQSLDIQPAVEYILGLTTLEDYRDWLHSNRNKVGDILFRFIEDVRNKPAKISYKKLDAATCVKVENPTSTVDSILADRGAVYGSYYGGVECRATMMEALNNKHIETKGCDLPESVRVVFSDILLKLMRAASDPMHEDSWIDLAGYSKIIQEMFEENPYVFKD